MTAKNIGRLIISILLSQAAGIIGSVFTAPSIPTWYPTLAKPSFNPPNWIFAPAWLTLYTLMGIAFYRVWTSGVGKKQIKMATIVFIAQLALNAAWSIIFFGAHNLSLAFLGIIVLLAFIVWTMRLFGRIDKIAAYLLIPYLAWVGFASVLNYSLWRLN